MKKLLLALSLMAAIGSQAQTVKKVVVEDYTGAWCPNCPIGIKNINDLHATNEDIMFPVAVHTGDALEYSTYKTALSTTMKINGVPSGFVDRHFFAGLGNSAYTTTLVGLSQSTTTTGFNQRKQETAIASVSIDNATFSPSSSVWEVQ